MHLLELKSALCSLQSAINKLKYGTDNRPPHRQCSECILLLTIFNGLPRVKFEKTNKVKWSERMELCISNEGPYFEKARTKKTDCECEYSDE